MVTSPHVVASQAGIEIMRAGGNAIEAAIAIATCLAVTYPHFSGFGGDFRSAAHHPQEDADRPDRAGGADPSAHGRPSRP